MIQLIFQLFWILRVQLVVQHCAGLQGEQDILCGAPVAQSEGYITPFSIFGVQGVFMHLMISSLFYSFFSSCIIIMFCEHLTRGKLMQPGHLTL